MNIRIAIAGNPNCGKTTLFNALTGSNQFVGNWPGVTVEKKEGKLKKNSNITITDLPGIYSLSPYTLEEIVTRDYLLNDAPDAILNVVDGTNIERNLYLTTQLTELGIPVVVAINMIDIVRKNGDTIDLDALSKSLKCPVIEISAIKGEGIFEAMDLAIETAKNNPEGQYFYRFGGVVEHTLAHIEEAAFHDLPLHKQRWYSIKLFERDPHVTNEVNLPAELMSHIENDITATEKELDDDSESIIINERYNLIESIVKKCYTRKNEGKLSTSEKIDKVVTNRVAALPIFIAIMFLVYYISVSTVGSWATDWANDGIFGEGWHIAGGDAYAEAMEQYAVPQEIIKSFEETAIENNLEPEKATNLTTLAYFYDDNGMVTKELPITYSDYISACSIEKPEPANYGTWIPGIPVVVSNALENANCASWLQALILDGIISGVGAVLGFVPQMLVLFLFLSFLEGCGYMSRIAFVMDKIFRRFGLSGKSFIPLLIGTGCGVPGIMSSRTIENESDRKMTIMTTTFIPCGAKLPVIALISGAIFGGEWWVAPSAYFMGIVAIMLSGLILKKTSLFASNPSPFIMELPAYHMPTLRNILNATWERGWSFIKKAGTVVLVATIFLWFASNYGLTGSGIGVVDMDSSFLAAIGSTIAWLFIPLGWGNWQSAVATVTGLIAKENVVGTFGVLFGGNEISGNGWQIWVNMQELFTPAAAYSFLAFNLLCAPCVAAIGAIRREMNNPKWTFFAIGYQCLVAYISGFLVYQLGMFFSGAGNNIGAIIAALILAFIIYLIFKPCDTEKLLAKKNNRKAIN